MRKNYAQTGTIGVDKRTYIEGDWYDRGLPPNVGLAPNVYIDTSYGFAAFHSQQPDALYIDEASGCYDRSTFIVSESGKVQVGKYCILNGTTIICNKNISIGDHCMISWGTIITDTYTPEYYTLEDRQEMMTKAAHDPLRSFPLCRDSSPVVLEENCWVGFGAIVMPGVRLGKGCVVGCKTIVTKDVPPYAVVIGSDEKIVRYLDPDLGPDEDEPLRRKILITSR